MFDSELPRPTPLHNGNCCFSDEEVAAVDRKAVNDLDWRDFAVIFNVSGCAVLPDQRRWFLPYAFDYARREPELASEFMASLIYFIADRDSGLDERVIAACREAIELLFRDWARDFVVIHYDLAACRAKQWTIPYDDQVQRSEDLLQLLHELSRFLAWIPLAEDLFLSLIREGRSDSDAAWFLELSRRLIERFGYWENTPAMIPARRAKRIVALANDVTQLSDAYAQIAGTIVTSERSPSYWRDVCASLALE
jgi:hypothetical protein